MASAVLIVWQEEQPYGSAADGVPGRCSRGSQRMYLPAVPAR